jgi:hypothetical protein
MFKAWLIPAWCAVLCTVALAGNTTYAYTGSPLTTCTAGPCPTDITEDYIFASVTFSAPLAANLPSTNELKSPNLVSWEIGDELGMFFYSSSDANAAGELSVLSLSTNSSGAISTYEMDALPAGLIQFPGGSVLEGNFGTFSFWTAITNTPGQWWPYIPSSKTYQVNQTGLGSNHGSVTGIIQTDGTIGTLGAANIINWTLVVSNGTNATYELTGGMGGNSTISTTGTGLTATSGGIYYNYAATGNVQISNASAGWELGLNSGGLTYEAVLPSGLNGNATQETGMQLVANVMVILTYFTPDAFFTSEQPSSVAAWDFLQFPGGSTPFGYYTFLQGSASTASAWLFHADLGYESVIPGATPGSAYFYDLASGHWWYTSSTLFPYLYDFTLNSWIYYFPNTNSPGHYLTNPRYFSNLTTQKFFTM